MQKDIGYLRCSKLSSYVEFNKMVHSLSVHTSTRQRDNITTKLSKKGTSTEYNFYLTLSLMLTQVLQNPHPEVQRGELLSLYQWFRINKPFTTQAKTHLMCQLKPQSHKYSSQKLKQIQLMGGPRQHQLLLTVQEQLHFALLLLQLHR